MLDIVLNFFADFFLIYNRDWKKILTDWLFLLLSAFCGIAAWRLLSVGGAGKTILGLLCCVGAVCFFVKGGKHAREAVEERNS